MCLDQILLNGYIDNALNERETAAVKEHLSACPQCLSLYSSYNVLISTVNQLPQPVVSDSFLDNIFLKIAMTQHPAFADLSAFYDSSINEDSYNEIGEHLDTCGPCREQLNNIGVIAGTVSRLDEFIPSQAFMDKLAAKIEQSDDRVSEEELPGSAGMYQPAPDFLNSLLAKIDDLAESELMAEQTACLSSEDLSAYLDNEKTGVPFNEIAARLESCPKCKSRYADLKVSRELVLNLQQPDVPFNFSRKIIEEINRKEKKIIRFIPFIRKAAPRVSMVAGIVIAGVLVSMSRSVMEFPDQGQTAANITVRSEDFLFSPGNTTYRTDAIEVLADNSQDDSLEIQDIGL